MSNIQTGAERMPHDLSHLGFLAGQIGRLITISTTPVIAGDSFEMDAVGILVIYPFCRGFGPLLEDKLCLIFKLAPSVCRMTFPILASLLVRLVVLLPFQLLRLSLATPSRWTPLALSVFLHCVVALLLTLL